MENKNIEKKTTWKNWLIKKLLTNDSTKEEILNYIASNDYQDNKDVLEDNNEKSLIKNILNLDDKSVEDRMVPRAEIVSIEKSQKIDEIFKSMPGELYCLSSEPLFRNEYTL